MKLIWLPGLQTVSKMFKVPVHAVFWQIGLPEEPAEQPPRPMAVAVAAKEWIYNSFQLSSTHLTGFMLFKLRNACPKFEGCQKLRDCSTKNRISDPVCGLSFREKVDDGEGIDKYAQQWVVYQLIIRNKPSIRILLQNTTGYYPRFARHADTLYLVWYLPWNLGPFGSLLTFLVRNPSNFIFQYRMTCKGICL